MMEIIENYYREHKQVFNECLARIPLGYKVEDIHEMRTSIKRLRALFQLVEFLSDDKFSTKKYLKRGRRLFKSVGTLREIQVEEMLVYKYEEKLSRNFNEYSEYLFEKEHREIETLKKSFGEIKGDRIFNDEDFFSAIKEIDKDSVEEKTQAFIKRKSNTLLKMNRKGKITKRVHKNRTILKQFYYLYDILTTLSDWHILLGMTRDEIREREQQIGEWHDRVNSLHYLKLFFTTYNYKPPEKYFNLKQFIFKERDEMKKAVVKHLFVGQTELWDESP
jgi:CHAD domain-containing protein